MEAYFSRGESPVFSCDEEQNDYIRPPPAKKKAIESRGHSENDVRTIALDGKCRKKPSTAVLLDRKAAVTTGNAVAARALIGDEGTRTGKEVIQSLPQPLEELDTAGDDMTRSEITTSSVRCRHPEGLEADGLGATTSVISAESTDDVNISSAGTQVATPNDVHCPENPQ